LTALAVAAALLAPGTAGTARAADEDAQGEKKSGPKLADLVKDLKKTEGMFTLYHDDQKLLVHIKTGDLAKI
jgi:hypothetical protein